MAGHLELDSLVTKQLTKLGLSVERPPDLVGWREFLARISKHYRHADDDRRLLARSLELSTGEMAQLQSHLAQEHSRLNDVLAAISSGVRGFHDVADRALSSMTDDDVSQVTTSLTAARDQLSARLSAPFRERDGAWWSPEEASHVQRAFSFLAEQMLDLIQATAQLAGMQKDLEVARAVQDMLVPAGDVVDRRGINLAGCCQPAAQCGGDWWATYDLADGKLLIVVGDSTGAGVAQAILTGVAKASCDVAMLLTEQRLTCVELLDMLNTCIGQAGQYTQSMTCAVSVFDPDTGQLAVGNAGHPFPFVWRRDRVAPMIERRLACGPPLGASAGSIYHSATIPLAVGDIVLWYTDGVTKALGESDERAGQLRLRRMVAHVASGDPVAIRDRIVDQVSSLSGTTTLADDMTLVVACVGW